MNDVRVVLDVGITFDVGERLVHSPMIEAVVGGVSTKLILDSGSTDHLLTLDVATCAGLALEPDEPGTDHAGEPIESWRVGDLPVVVGGERLDLHDVVAFEGPPPFAGWGIGGFLSPQHLHASAILVIDLVADRLSLVDSSADDVTMWVQARHPSLRAVALERVLEDTLAVVGAIEPFDDVVTMLNTGSSTTEFARAAVPGLAGGALDESRRGFGLSGAEVEAVEVADQVLRLGGARVGVGHLLVRDQMPPPPGIVGMDVLRGTVVIVPPDVAEPVGWLVPAGV